MYVRNTEVEMLSTLRIINLVTTALSMIGSSWMFYKSFRNKRKSPFCQMVTYLSLANFWFSVSNLLSFFRSSSPTYNWLCLLQGFMGQYFFIFSMLLSFSISLVSYQSLRLGGAASFTTRRLKTNSVLACAVHSFALALTPFIFPSLAIYKEGALFCSIGLLDNNVSQIHKLLVLLMYQGAPFFVGFFLTLILYCKIVARIRSVFGSMHSYKIFWYPAVMFVVFVPNLAYSIDNIFTEESRLWIQIVHIIWTNSLGFLDSIVYGLLFLKNISSTSAENESELYPSRNQDIYRPLRPNNNQRPRGEVIRQLFEEPEPLDPLREENMNFVHESQPSTNRSYNSIASNSN